MKPHIKVIQRNGVDIFVTSSMQMKPVKRARYPIVGRDELERSANEFLINRGAANAGSNYASIKKSVMARGVANTYSGMLGL